MIHSGRVKTLYQQGGTKVITMESLGLSGADAAAAHLRGLSAATPANAYRNVPLVRRSVDLRKDSLAAVPFALKRNGKQVDAWPPGWRTPLSPVMRLMELDAMCSGWALALKLRNNIGPNGSIQGLQRINVNFVEWEVKDGENRYTYTPQGVATDVWTDDDVIVMREDSPSSDVGPGDAAVFTALAAAQLSVGKTKFAGGFFEGGATPPIIITSREFNFEDGEQEKIENTFKRRITGAWDWWKARFYAGEEIQVHQLDYKLDQMALTELYDQIVSDIAASTSVPKPVLLGDAANYATMGKDWEMFWKSTIQPRAIRYQDAFNTQCFSEFAGGYEIVEMTETLEPFQEDEHERSQSAVNFRLAGYTRDEVSAMLGITDQFGEVMKQEGDDASIVNRTGTGTSAQPDVSLQKSELTRWQKFALKNIGKDARRFVTLHISPGMAADIERDLRHAHDAAAVREVFAKAVERVPVLPRGNGRAVLALPDEIQIDLESAVSEWDETRPENSGLLSADVTNRYRYDRAEGY